MGILILRALKGGGYQSWVYNTCGPRRYAVQGLGFRAISNMLALLFAGFLHFFCLLVRSLYLWVGPEVPVPTMTAFMSHEPPRRPSLTDAKRKMIP